MDEPRARFEARVEALLEQIDKRLAEMGERISSVENRMASVESRLVSIENRLDQKASLGWVSFWGASVMGWTSILVGTGVAVIKLWP
ncbi:MAG: hypothetical protein ACREOH_19250 [Candidatus Entotheonellia bacterium]